MQRYKSLRFVKMRCSRGQVLRQTPNGQRTMHSVAADPHLFGVVVLVGAIGTKYPCQQISSQNCISHAASVTNLENINFSYKNAKTLGSTCQTALRTTSS